MWKIRSWGLIAVLVLEIGGIVGSVPLRGDARDFPKEGETKASRSDPGERALAAALESQGFSPEEARRRSVEFSFLSHAMVSLTTEPDAMAAAGSALGTFLGVAERQYGAAVLQDGAAALVVATRSGLPPDLGVAGFRAMAEAGYPFQEVQHILLSLGDRVRMTVPGDRGKSLVETVEALAARRTAFRNIEAAVTSGGSLESPGNRGTMTGEGGSPKGSGGGTGGNGPGGGGSGGGNGRGGHGHGT